MRRTVISPLFFAYCLYSFCNDSFSRKEHRVVVEALQIAPTFLARRDSHCFLAAQRYGPQDDHHGKQQSQSPPVVSRQQKQEFRQLVTKALSVSDPQHLPSLMTQNIPLVLSLTEGQQGSEMVESILNDDSLVQNYGASRVSQAIDFILSFAQDFVDQASQLDKQNKELLGLILRAMSGDQTSRQREEALNEILKTQKLSAGFLRHLEGECERIASAPKTTPEGARLVQMLKLIQARVLEELAAESLGEAATVLGQLIGYDDKAERLAVLDAGLTVRGVEFAEEMLALTQEALEGFTRVPGGADPGLVTCIKEVDERLKSFIEKER